MHESKQAFAIDMPEIISTVIQTPIAKVDRESFLQNVFNLHSSDIVADIVERGPVEAGIDRADLKKLAGKIILEETLSSSSLSFVSGLPGGPFGIAMIPADVVQSFTASLRLAQKLAYLYGEGDLWDKDLINRDKVTNTLLLYCAVMFGASGSAAAVRVMSSKFAQKLSEKFTKQTLRKKILCFVGKKAATKYASKTTVAKGLSKGLPIAGAVISGGITFVSMNIMGKRLVMTLDVANFEYSQAAFEGDWREILKIAEA